MADTRPERTIGGLHAALMRRLDGLDRGARILDIGCGSGAWLERMRRAGFTNLCAVDAGRDPEIAGVRFIPGDLDADDVRLEGEFDLISMIEVIEHLSNPGRTLSLIARHLSASGHALVTTPNIHSLRCRLKFALTGGLPSFDAKSDPTHTTPLILEGFERMADRFGLRIDATWTYPEEGTLIFGRAIRAGAAALRGIIADPLPGDSLCMTLVGKPRTPR